MIIITGASSGLGKALALQAAQRSSNVVMIARNNDELKKTADQIRQNGGVAYYYSFDLHQNAQIKQLYEKIRKDIPFSPTILINNAGYSAAGFVSNTPVEIYENNFRVNLFAPIALIQCVIPEMIKQKHGTIVNIMGSAMYHSFPGTSSYSASKSALKAVHESLKIELSGLPIRLLSINPGAFRSNYVKNIQASQRLKDFTYSEDLSLPIPDGIVTKIFEAIEKDKSELNLSSLSTRIGYHLSYWMPKFLERILIKRNQELISKRSFDREI
ncbi:MAG: SDR family NAD(P)-dependent oxidoreductase [Desulfobacterales bacterium]|nr:SDR family NAD(P)-dependent oxidoreductase [Desulfobacterales bacterium]